jgi:hypothetical protein
MRSTTTEKRESAKSRPMPPFHKTTGASPGKGLENYRMMSVSQNMNIRDVIPMGASEFNRTAKRSHQ